VGAVASEGEVMAVGLDVTKHMDCHTPSVGVVGTFPPLLALHYQGCFVEDVELPAGTDYTAGRTDMREQTGDLGVGLAVGRNKDRVRPCNLSRGSGLDVE
jgi:hypothetical protein